jgi:hypothetical protein
VGQVLAVGVEMVDLGQVGRLVLAPVDDQQLVPVGVELLDHGGPDEPGPAQHHHPHLRSFSWSEPEAGQLAGRAAVGAPAVAVFRW